MGAYNKKLVNDGAKDTSKFCTGFVLSESTKVVNEDHKKNKGKYIKTHDFDMLVGFFSSVGNDEGYDGGRNLNGGYFKYVPIANCLVTSTSNCGMGSRCKDNFYVTNQGTCEAKCPKAQYPKDGVCVYRTPHCIDGNADGTTCTKC